MLEAFLARSHAECPNPAAVSTNTPTSLRVLARMRAWKNVGTVANALRRDGASAALSRDALDDCHLYYFFSLFRLGEAPHGYLKSELSSFLESRAKSTSSVEGGHKEVLTTRALRLLQAELRQYVETGASQPVRQAAQRTCIDELGRLQEHFWAAAHPSGEPIENDNLLWWRRVTMSIVNVATKAGNWQVALSMLQKLREVNQQPQPQRTSTAYDIEILSRIAKVFLQMGNLDEARRYLSIAECIEKNATSEQAQPCVRILLNRGLLAFAEGDYGKAIEIFDTAIQIEKQKRQEQTFSFAGIEDEDAGGRIGDNNNDHSRTLFVGIDIESNVMVEALNNFAICCMYTCDLHRATERLEAFILEDPTSNITDAVIFNLCTMYELSCDNKTTIAKKRVLQQAAQRFSIHDVSVGAFRIA